jgi:uncharacterized iron-regulated membrane protein
VKGGVRKAFARVHRYAGLAMAGFLAIAGLTGSVIAFAQEIDSWLNPELYKIAGVGTPLPMAALAQRVEQSDPEIRVMRIEPPLGIRESALLTVEPRQGRGSDEAPQLAYDQVFAEPVTGAVLGTRLWGAARADRAHLIPFLYKLHYSLHIPGPWGLWLMGAIACAWCLDCFIGLYLTLPRGWRFLAKWRRAWKIKSGAGFFRTSFDLHRAGGLWLWFVLLMLAVSSISLNLRDEVFNPVVSLFSPVTPSIFELRVPDEIDRAAGPSFDEIAAQARREAQRLGWAMDLGSVAYIAAYDLFGVRFDTETSWSGDSRFLYLDGRDGRLLDRYVLGDGTAGDAVIVAQFALHSGRIAGLAGRIAICLAGLAVAALSITGVIIWWLKQSRGRTHRAAAAPAAPASG